MGIQHSGSYDFVDGVFGSFAGGATGFSAGVASTNGGDSFYGFTGAGGYFGIGTGIGLGGGFGNIFNVSGGSGIMVTQYHGQNGGGLGVPSPEQAQEEINRLRNWLNNQPRPDCWAGYILIGIGGGALVGLGGSEGIAPGSPQFAFGMAAGSALACGAAGAVYGYRNCNCEN